MTASPAPSPPAPVPPPVSTSNLPAWTGYILGGLASVYGYLENVGRFDQPLAQDGRRHHVDRRRDPPGVAWRCCRVPARADAVLQIFQEDR